MTEDRKGHGSLSNINSSDAGDTGTGDGTITNTGMPTGQQGGTGGAADYPGPGQAADRGDGRAGNIEYGTGIDMPGTGGDNDMETMADDIRRAASNLNSTAGRGADTGLGGDTDTTFGLNGARGVGTTGSGGPTSINATDRGSVTGTGSDTGLGSATGLGSTTGIGATVNDEGDNTAGEDTGLGSTGGNSAYGSEGSGSGMGTDMAR